ncbi:flavin monoamine oxidase family protein [Ancylobacter polymorphus]|uniref:Tryptophan 2-monooxygenase n=1 Tax=Ancylobacter polymorphus TaxID=223390 RepID=A0A9E7A2K3_9HYPH|nr:NAD(P)/FAD-dependent oxidoreductase [Ancylobacter polymorphus]UOK73380.1 FAD-dependent oxidoreductase [Ancylobacter polymorphus]
MNTDIDIGIVGGGAAGIAAARRLAKSGFSILLLEASSRLGGRAWTSEVAGLPLDLGCGWLHSAERNPWTAVAEASGFVVDRREAAWSAQDDGLRPSPNELRAARQAFADWERRLPALVPASDCAADALVPGCEWNPYIRAICGFSNGVTPDHLSAGDYLAYDQACSYRNWRTPDGYGTLIASSLPSSVPVRLGTPVCAVAEHGHGVKITTARGSILARAVILTVSTAVLKSGAIDLPPALDPWRDAASLLPLGQDEKLFLKIDGETAFVSETHLFGDLYDSRTCAFYIRPFGWPIIEGYLGGDSARILARDGLVAGFDLAVEQLVKLVGSDIRSKLKPLAGSNWSNSDRIGGSYSCALPGHASARRQLARPWNGRIFFAGEATHVHDFSTAHGAHDSGLRAAEEAVAALERQRESVGG